MIDAFALPEASASWICLAMDRSPAPWKVSATSGRLPLPRTICVAGPPGIELVLGVVAAALAVGAGFGVLTGAAALLVESVEQPANAAEPTASAPIPNSRRRDTGRPI
jgi:hypothetical protein